MAKLKRRAKIERLGLLGNRLINRLNIVAKTTSPKTRQAIKNFPAIAIRVVTPVGRRDHPWIGFELPIACKRHPVGIKLRLRETRF